MEQRRVHRFLAALRIVRRITICYSYYRNPRLTLGEEMTLLEEFSTGLEGEDLSQLLREAKAESENSILGQGVACLALFIAEVLMQALVASGRGAFLHLVAQSTEQQPPPSHG